MFVVGDARRHRSQEPRERPRARPARRRPRGRGQGALPRDGQPRAAPTPLNAIIGFSEILTTETMAGVGPEQRRDYARIIQESGQHLLEVVNSLLDMSQIESGNFEFAPAPFDVAPLVAGCIDLMKLKADARRGLAEDRRRGRSPRARRGSPRLPADPDQPRLERRQVHSRGRLRDGDREAPWRHAGPMIVIRHRRRRAGNGPSQAQARPFFQGARRL